MKRTLKFKGVGEYIIDTDTMEFRAKYERFKGLPDKVLEFRDMLWDIFTSPDPNKRLNSDSISPLDPSFVQEMTILEDDLDCIKKGIQTRRSILSSRFTTDNSGKPYISFYVLNFQFDGCCLLKNLVSVEISNPLNSCDEEGMEVYRYVAENMAMRAKSWITERGYEDCCLGSKAGEEIIGLINNDISKRYEEISSKGS